MPPTTIRTYYYFLSSQSHLFLQETKHKNFTSCFKNAQFLKFFFRQLRPNEELYVLDSSHSDTKQRELQYQWVSECFANAGQELERNLLECELGTPFVFQSIEEKVDGDDRPAPPMRTRRRRGVDEETPSEPLSPVGQEHAPPANELFSHVLTFANGQFRAPFYPTQLYMDPEGRLCQNFIMQPWSKYGVMKGVLSDVLCNKLQWRIISDDDEALHAGASYFLQWNGTEYPVELREDNWEDRVWEMRQRLHQKMVKEKT